jgi:hypothetical protein
LAQRSPSCLSSRLNGFWWRSELDVRSQASAKWESGMATKKLMVRFGGGRLTRAQNPQMKMSERVGDEGYRGIGGT